MDGAGEIQFCRRQQRSGPGPGRGPDRCGQRRAQARGQDARHLRARQRSAGLPSPLREFLTAKLKRDAGIDCAADDILIVSGSLQALDLVNATLLGARRHRDHRAGHLSGRAEPADAARRQRRRHSARSRAACGWTRWPTALADLKRRGITPKYIYTIPTVQNPTGTIMPEARRAELLDARRTIWRADLRGRLLCRPDLGRTNARPRSMP